MLTTLWKFAIITTLGLSVNSCVRHRDLITLNGNEVNTEFEGFWEIDTIAVKSQEEYKVRPHDLLFITVNTIDQSSGQIVREQFSTQRRNVQSNNFGPTSAYYRSYEVDQHGYIYLPLIDSIYVAGKTTNEIRRQLDIAFAPYIKFATYRVKLSNMRVTILGEVNRPGIHYYFNSQTNILEAISQAGDFGEFANRRKVKLIRQAEDGRKSVILNLHRPDFISSPYFYIQPNDVLYVEPIKSKAFDAGSNSVSIVLSVISTAVLLANIMLSLNNKK